MTLRQTLIISAAAIAGALSHDAHGQAPSYTVKALGSLNGASEAFGINDAGKAVGWTYTPSGVYQAALFQNGQIILLSTPLNTNSSAAAISTDGRIVGKLGVHAALWTSPNAYSDLGTLGGQEAIATGINDNGLVTMGAQNNQAHWKAAYRQLPNGVTTAFPMLGGLQGRAAACSNGNAVGWSDLANGQTHATLWANGVALDYGTLGGPASQFLGSSAQGNACGWSYLVDRQKTPQFTSWIKRAVVNGPNKTLRNLGEPYAARPYPSTFGSVYKGFVFRYYDRGVFKTANVVGVDVAANDLNTTTVVGNARLYLYPTGTLQRAVAWVNGTFYDLTNLTRTSNWTLRSAWGINKNGQIVGQGMAPNGQLQAYRLDLATGGTTGLGIVRFTGVTNNVMTPVYASTTSPTTIPTLDLYVRKSDGMCATSFNGTYSSTGWGSWNDTNPILANQSITLTIDERSNPVSPNGVNNWNSLCNGLQAGYTGLKTGQDGTLRVFWNTGNWVNVFNSFFPNDEVLSARWKFSVGGTAFLSMRLRIHKGPGF